MNPDFKSFDPDLSKINLYLKSSIPAEVYAGDVEPWAFFTNTQARLNHRDRLAKKSLYSKNEIIIEQAKKDGLKPVLRTSVKNGMTQVLCYKKEAEKFWELKINEITRHEKSFRDFISKQAITPDGNSIIRVDNWAQIEDLIENGEG